MTFILKIPSTKNFQCLVLSLKLCRVKRASLSNLTLYSNRSDFKATISNRDKKLWSRIINDDKNALHNLLPSKLNRPLRRRGHDFELPIVKTERFKNAFINRCLFNFI